MSKKKKRKAEKLGRPVLTEKQIEFLAVYTASPFLSFKQVCRQAGVTPSVVEAWRGRSEGFRLALLREHLRSQQAANMDRKQVMEGLLEAIEIAKDRRQATGMISGWKEIGRMCGYYEPERKEITLSLDKIEVLKEIKGMSTEALLEYAMQQDEKDKIQQTALLGEYDLLDADEVPDDPED